MRPLTGQEGWLALADFSFLQDKIKKSGGKPPFLTCEVARRCGNSRIEGVLHSLMRFSGVATVLILLLALIVWAQGEKESFQPAAYYKDKCAECHGSEAEKKFNPDLPESQMIDSILNGAKAEDSRDMPAFAEKGIDETKAKSLITYMKSVRE